MATQTRFRLDGYDIEEKIVQGGGNSGRVYVPRKWLKKRVKIILLEDPDVPTV